jgi:SAM-dependent methyltransferase
MKKENIKYVHSEVVHNMNAPKIIVPMVLELFPLINSVVDFGCGLGTWLKAFKDNGIKEIFGIDGEWCNKNLLLKYIDENEFKCVDLETPIQLNKVYDLVISLEVGEHLLEQSADIFIQSLVNAGKIILFSAAIPGQGGINHVNEQWPLYWVKKFQHHGFKCYDIIRPQIWNNTNVEVWYRQNIFLAVHNSIEVGYKDTDILSLVHPDILNKKIAQIRIIEQGKRGISFYLPRLFKSIINKFLGSKKTI